MTPPFCFVNHRDALPVAEQPSVQVKHWRIFRAANGNRHLLIILANGSLRITSAITSVDHATAELTTESGRRYQLLDLPEGRQPERTLLGAYALRSGLVDAVDVSDELWQTLAVPPKSEDATA